MLPLSRPIPTYKISGLLGSHASPAYTCGQLTDTARSRVGGLQHQGAGDKPLLRKSLGDRDSSAQCPQSGPWNHPKAKERVPSHDRGLPATGCRSGPMGWMGTDTQEECSLQLWCLRDWGPRARWSCCILELPSWGHVARTHRVSTWLPLNDTFPVPFPAQALLQGSSALCSQLKLLISPAHVYHPFYLMHC